MLARSRPPDALVLRCPLPGMSCEQVVKRLLSEEATSSVPIFVVVGDGGCATSAGKVLAGRFTEPVDAETIRDAIIERLDGQA
ncbi:MAG: hypothetical protein ACLGH3_09945 [Actinomycetota bacterium]